MVRLIESIASSQISSTQTPVHISIVQHAEHLQVNLEPNYSLTRKRNLFSMLEQISRQHEWLGNNLQWEDGATFKVWVPTWKMEQMQEPIFPVQKPDKLEAFFDKTE